MLYYNCQRKILILAKDKDIVQFFRVVNSSFDNASLIISARITPHICKQRYLICFFEEIVFNQKTFNNKVFCKDTFCVLITDIKHNKETLEKYYAYGIDLVLQKPLDKVFIRSLIYREQARLKEGCKSYKLLNRYDKSITINSCKIYLTKKEFAILSIIIQRRDFVSISEIRDFLDGEASEQAIRINIHRTRKKILKATGLNIIQNKYGYGYKLKI